MENVLNDDIIDCGGNIKLKRTKENNNYKIIIQDDSNEIEDKLTYHKQDNGDLVFTELSLGKIMKNSIITGDYFQFEIGNKEIYISNNNELMIVKDINNNINNNNIINNNINNNKNNNNIINNNINNKI